MSAPSYTFSLIGKTLQDLAPLVAAAIAALDRPGTRSLRRKLDGEFHFLVGCYGTLQRENLPEEQWKRCDSPVYERATEVWPGRAAACKAKAAKTVPAASAFGPLRLAVDNGQTVRATESASLGGAA